MKPIFILGVGAQKAGTGWLYKTLSKENIVNFGFTKEYHIWDYVFSDLCKGFKAPLKNPDDAMTALRRMMQESSEIYTKYFQGLINSTINVTGDITPSYSMIDKSGLKQIVDVIKGAGFDIKVIYLMRDPIDRLWSAVRMEKRVKLRDGVILDDAFCELRVREYLGMKDQMARGDYKTTVQNITQVFNDDEVCIELYENLFIRRNTKKLEDFLGLTLNHVDFSMHVNQSKQELMSQEVCEHLFDFFAPQYKFCRDNFTEVNELWRNL